MGQPFTPTLLPDPSTWPARIRPAPPRHIQPLIHRLRTQLGLPTNRAVLMTGHQPVIWHCGVLAKYLALDALARRTDAHPAWLVIDQDRPATIDLPFPALGADGSLTRATLRLTPGQNTPIAENPHPAVAPHFDEIAAALNAADPTLPPWLRVAHACLALARPLLAATDAPTILPATALARTDVFRDLVTQMATDPWRCAQAYNAAAAAHPAAGVRALLVDRHAGRCELPLWWLPPARPARPVFAADLRAIPSDQLATKALLTTAIVRALGCDLFIHGTGGGGSGAGDDDPGYDRVMEAWIAGWNPTISGVPLASLLAPMVVATATLHLPFPDRHTPSSREIDHARWAARRARHDPALLGDHEAARARRTLVERIASIPRRDRAARAEAFARLHALEAQARLRHADRLAELEARARTLRARRAEAAIIEDRTWPFPYFPAADLRRLADRIAEVIGA